MGTTDKIGLAKRLRTHVEALAAIDPGRDRSSPAGQARTLDYLRGALPKTFRREEQLLPGQGPHAINLSAGPAPKQAGCPVLIVGAHWDAAELGRDGKCPGADDNASAVAVALEVSRRFQENGRFPSFLEVQFVFWCLEESGYLGSAFHAAELRRQGRAVEGAVVLESVGYFDSKPGSQNYPEGIRAPLERQLGRSLPDTGDFYAIVGHAPHTEFLQKIQRALSTGMETVSIPLALPEALHPGIDMSDHRNYHLEGYPSAMICDTVFYRNNRYHTVRDTPDSLDYGRMAELTLALSAWLETRA